MTIPAPPLLDGALADEARAAVAALIAQPSLGHLEEREEADGLSLAGGLAGEALVLAHYSLATGDDEVRARAEAAVDHLVELLPQRLVAPDLFSGFVGSAWLMEHLRGRLWPLDEDANEAIDEVLAEALGSPERRWPSELILGLAGFLVYACERLGHGGGAGLVAPIVHRLVDGSEAREGGLAWLTPAAELPPHQRRSAPAGYYNSGLAHGAAGPVAVLGRLARLGAADEEARGLLRGAIRWLLAQRRTLDGGGVAFVAWHRPELLPEAQEAGRGRLAWCYDELGIAVALLQAGQGLGDEELIAAALGIARQAATRPADTSGVVDSGLCHGSAGAAHLFHRLYRASADPLFAAASRYWFGETLHRFRDPVAAGAGFYRRDALTGLRRHGNDLLEAGGGVGLALLSALGEASLDWDRFLAVDVAPRPSLVGSV